MGYWAELAARWIQDLERAIDDGELEAKFDNFMDVALIGEDVWAFAKDVEEYPYYADINEKFMKVYGWWQEAWQSSGKEGLASIADCIG